MYLSRQILWSLSFILLKEFLGNVNIKGPTIHPCRANLWDDFPEFMKTFLGNSLSKMKGQDKAIWINRSCSAFM